MLESSKVCGKCGGPRHQQPSGRWACRPCGAQYNRDRWSVKREQQRAAAARGKLMRHFGLTVEQRDAMIEARGGRCDICGRVPEGQHDRKEDNRLHVDHCHSTGRIRGMLCSTCNLRLGWTEKWLPEITRYLDAA